jgi:hypothetical protein
MSGAVLVVGRPEQLTAAITYQDGSTASATKVSWTTDDASVADVDARGLLVPHANGVATITATLGGVVGTRRVRVVPNYAGTWSGTFRIAACDGGWCGRHQTFEPSDATFQMTLTQEGLHVSGRIVLPQMEGVVSCELSDQGSLQFDGMYTPPDLTWKEPEMRLWNTTVEADRLLGTFWYGSPDRFEQQGELTSVFRQVP